MLDSIKKIDLFKSHWDALLLFIAILVSTFILTDKLVFLIKIYGVDFFTFANAQLIVINLAAYLAVCSWVFMILLANRSWLLRFYVLFVGFYFCTVVRMIEVGESSTRQGVDFALVSHLVLTSIGYQAWKIEFFEWFIKTHIFLIFLLGFILKYYLGKIENTKALRYSLSVFILALVVSFLNPDIASVPSSIRQNSLVYLIQSAWFPVSDFELKESATKTHTKIRHTKQQLANNDNKHYLAAGKGKNIVIFTLESTGANMLEMYQHNDAVQGSTPFLSELAQTAIKFNNTSAVMTSTTKSLVSILCGIEPYLSIEVFEATIGIPTECLPSRLSKIGYETIYFQSATKLYENRDSLAVKMGFEKFISLDDVPNEDKQGARLIGPFGLEDRVLLNEHQRWIDQQKVQGSPFMAFYLTLAQHHPYLQGKKANGYGDNLSKGYQSNYVGSLKYIDTYLKDIVEQYKKAGLYENTIFIVIGDHGEAFGLEHPQRFHNNSLYREGLWVPFLIVNRDLFPKQVEDNEVTSLLDVAPSIEYLLGMEVSQDYRGYPAFNSPQDRKVYAACWYKNRCLAVLDNQYKYIHNFEDSADELYNIKLDIHEQNNLAERFPEIVEQYKQDLFLWYSDVMLYYGTFYQSIDENYIKQASSYYQFPRDFYSFKKQAKQNERHEHTSHQ